MALELRPIFNQLLNLKANLVKLSYPNRTKSTLDKKLQEAENLVVQFNSVVDILSDQIKAKLLSPNISLEIKDLCEKTEQIFNDIKIFCSQNYSQGQGQEPKMADFNLKVALSLLPSMTDTEINTKEIIDGIEYYSSTLKAEARPELISFVLKTRLSQSAKLKLCTKYDTVAALIQDMRKQLLPVKAATAIHARMHNIKQNDRSVEDFGKELSELFVDLTVSQAEGKSDAYNILRPINEKIAIKQFADGLRNRRLSTIIAARNFECLKDAIQVAKEEEVASASTSADVMGMSKQYYANYPNRSFQGHRGQRRGYRGYRGNFPNNRGRMFYRTQGQTFNRNYQQGERQVFRGNSTRGRYGKSTGRISNNRHVNFMSPERDSAGSDMTPERPSMDQTSATQTPNREALNHFFRF